MPPDMSFSGWGGCLSPLHPPPQSVLQSPQTGQQGQKSHCPSPEFTPALPSVSVPHPHGCSAAHKPPSQMGHLLGETQSALIIMGDGGERGWGAEEHRPGKWVAPGGPGLWFLRTAGRMGGARGAGVGSSGTQHNGAVMCQGHGVIVLGKPLSRAHRQLTKPWTTPDPHVPSTSPHPPTPSALPRWAATPPGLRCPSCPHTAHPPEQKGQGNRDF